MLSLLAPVRGRMYVAVVLQFVAAIAGVVPFIAVAELGTVLLDPDGMDRDRVWTIAAIGACALVVRLACALSAAALTHLADNDLSLRLRRDLADRLGRLPLGWFTDRGSGQVRKAVTDDVSAMHHLVGHTVTDVVSAAVVPLVSLIYLTVVDWRFTLVTLIPIATAVWCYGRLMAVAKQGYAAYDRSLARISAAAVEFVQGIAVVKTFGQTGRAHRRFVEAADEMAEFFLEWVRGTFRRSATTQLLLSPVFMLLWVLGTGTVAVTAGWLPAVDVLPFALLALGLTAPITTLAYSYNEIRIARQAADRVGMLLSTPTLPEPGTPAEPSHTKVEFDAASYSYDGRTNAIENVSIELDPGTVTALVGPSGSGKTTLARLLPRFFDVTEGAVRIGGVDVRHLATGELYRHVSFVFQDVQLLRASIRDNITLARPDADFADIVAVAKAAQIHDRIMELPAAYDSIAGVDARLSGGEAQRVSIARALLADTPILVLDEATAFADPESEAAIQDALTALTADRTLLVIAHRLSTISGADQIVVLNRGRVAELGTHDELMRAGGWYARSSS